MTESRIAGDAIESAGRDIAVPTKALLEQLHLLPNATDLEKAGKAGAAFGGPPDSVAIIEAGATAASKWWSTAIGAGSVGLTGAIAGVWNNLGADWIKAFALLALGLVLASAALGIAYLFASDVRGRAAAMVATIDARRSVALVMAEQASAVSIKKASPSMPPSPVGPLPVKNADKSGAAEQGWKAIAMRDAGAGLEYLLVKGQESSWVKASQVSFS